MKKPVTVAVLLLFLASSIPAFAGAQGKVNSGRRARKAVRNHIQKTNDYWAQQRAEMGLDEVDVGTGTSKKPKRGKVPPR